MANQSNTHTHTYKTHTKTEWMKSIQRKYTTKRLSRNKALNTDFATLKTKDESRMIKGNVNENRVVHAKHLTHTHKTHTIWSVMWWRWRKIGGYINQLLLG